MIMDSQLSFSAAQAITTASAASSNVSALDLSGGNTNYGVNASRFGEDLGVGDGKNTPKIVISVSTAFATGTGATLNFQFQGSTNSSAWTTYIESGAIAASALTKGATWVFDWPRKALGASLPRYVRTYYELGTGTFSTGTLEANVVLNADGWVNFGDQYPSNYVVGA